MWPKQEILYVRQIYIQADIEFTLKAPENGQNRLGGVYVTGEIPVGVSVVQVYSRLAVSIVQKSLATSILA